MDFKSEIKPFQVCRTCLEEILTSSFFSLDCTKADTQLTIKQKLSYCIPELDLNIASNSIICDKCTEFINLVYNFKNKCLQSELQIYKYIMQQVQHTDDIDLAEVACFQQPYHINLAELKTEVLEIQDYKIEESTSAVCNAIPSEAEECIQPIKQEYLPQCVAFDVDESYIDYSALPVENNSDTYYNSSSSVSQVDCVQNMPKYQRKTTRAHWDAETMKQALTFVKNGGSIRQAGRRFSIPESSIRKRKKAFDDGVDVVAPYRIGKYCVFSSVQEKELKDQIHKLEKLYHGMTKVQLRKLAFSYAEANQIKHNFNVQTQMAGKDWYNGFLKRNPGITLRKPNPIAYNSTKLDKSDCDLTGENNLNVLPNTKKSDSPIPSTSANLKELSPLPKPSRAKPQNRKKQKSEISTDTPNKEKLEIVAAKRTERQRHLETKQKDIQKKGTKRKVFEESESEDISESELCNDDEMDDLDLDDTEKCIVCGEGCIKDEVWFKCLVCKRWAHALCTGEDSPEEYVCDLCDT